MPDPLKKPNTETTAAATTAGGVFGAGLIDLRPKAKLQNAKHLGSTWDQIKKNVKPGDVIIGANKTAPQAISGEAKDLLKTYKKSRAQGKGILGASKKAIKQFDVASVVSKFSDPDASHAAVFATKGDVVYGGGSWDHVSSGEIPRDTSDLMRETKKGRKAHFVLLRPKKGVSQIPGIHKKKGKVGAINTLARKAGGHEDYKTLTGIKNQIVDWVTPKFRRSEKVKTKAQQALEKCYIGGTCGTTGALMSEKTVGGKVAPKVLPKDYLRSADYDVVGKIGTGKSSRLSKLMFKIPKYTVKAGVAGAAGLGMYGAVKGYKKLKKGDPGKITKTAEQVYQYAFIDELEKIAGNTLL